MLIAKAEFLIFASDRFFFRTWFGCGWCVVAYQVKKLQAEKRLDLLVDADLKSQYSSLELEEMVQVSFPAPKIFPLATSQLTFDRFFSTFLHMSLVIILYPLPNSTVSYVWHGSR
jgi:hypothetical protein